MSNTKQTIDFVGDFLVNGMKTNKKRDNENIEKLIGGTKSRYQLRFLCNDQRK